MRLHGVVNGRMGDMMALAVMKTFGVRFRPCIYGCSEDVSQDMKTFPKTCSEDVSQDML